jgi:hypothetical protein
VKVDDGLTNDVASNEVTHFAQDGAYVGCRDWDMGASISRARLRP